MITALNIGRYVRARGWDTAVADNEQCMSACAVLWLAGAKRYMADTAVIGFHAAYQVEQDRAVESSFGNALVGAYLNGLGLSDNAVIYITYSPPGDMQILSKADALAVGIDVAPLRPDLAKLGANLPAMPTAEVAPTSPQPVGLTGRVAKVRDVWTTVHREPDGAAPAMARLRPGTPVTVLRQLPNWAEVEVGSVVGYVLSHDIDPS